MNDESPKTNVMCINAMYLALTSKAIADRYKK